MRLVSSRPPRCDSCKLEGPFGGDEIDTGRAAVTPLELGRRSAVPRPNRQGRAGAPPSIACSGIRQRRQGMDPAPPGPRLQRLVTDRTTSCWRPPHPELRRVLCLEGEAEGGHDRVRSDEARALVVFAPSWNSFGPSSTTRTWLRPGGGEGDAAAAEENKLLTKMLDLCDKLDSSGHFFLLEAPAPAGRRPQLRDFVSIKRVRCRTRAQFTSKSRRTATLRSRPPAQRRRISTGSTRRSTQSRLRRRQPHRRGLVGRVIC